MNNEIAAPIVEQLNRIMKGLLGCSVEFQRRDQLSRTLWDLSEVDIAERTGATLPSYLVGNQRGLYGFPVLTTGKLGGMLVVADWDRTAFATEIHKLFHLGELFTLIMERALNGQQHTDLLKQLESRVRLTDTSSNVVFLSKPRRVSDDAERVELPVAPEAPLPNQPLLIHLQNYTKIEKIAFDLHTLSGRWAFLNASDLPANTFESKEELATLGSVTIFIRDLTSLSMVQQKALLEYLMLPASMETPHFIAMVHEMPNGLIDKGLLMRDLVEKFAFTQIAWAANESSDVINATLQQILERTQIVVANPETAFEHIVSADNLIPFHPNYFETDAPTLH